MNEQAVREYRQTSIQTGSPVKLVAMLYDGAIRFIAEARAAIEANDIPTRADRLRRATRIVQELNNALEYSVDSDIPVRLAALYDYVEYEILQATTRNHVGPLDNATRVLQDLADAWHQLAEKNVPAQETADEVHGERTTEPVAPLPDLSPDEESVRRDEVAPTYDEVPEHARRASLSLSA